MRLLSLTLFAFSVCYGDDSGPSRQLDRSHGCDHPPAPEHGTVRLTHAVHLTAAAGVIAPGSTATQSCNEGYKISAGDRQISCSTGGSWIGTFITCSIRVIDCGSAPTPTHGSVQLTTDGQTVFNSTAFQACNDGYENADAIATITCLANGQWSSSITCLIKDCGRAPKPAHGTVQLIKAGQTFYRSTASQLCNTGYSVVAGTGIITCQATGQWSTSITCIRTDCGIAPEPTHGTVRLTNAGQTVYGSTASQSCNTGYKMVAGTGTITCQADGIWSTSVTCIIEMQATSSKRPTSTVTTINNDLTDTMTTQSHKIPSTTTITLIRSTKPAKNKVLTIYTIPISPSFPNPTKLSTATTLSDTKAVPLRSTQPLTEPFLISTTKDSAKTSLLSQITKIPSPTSTIISKLLKTAALTGESTAISNPSTSNKETALLTVRTELALTYIASLPTANSLFISKTSFMPKKLKSPTYVTTETATTEQSTFMSPANATLTVTTKAIKIMSPASNNMRNTGTVGTTFKLPAYAALATQTTLPTLLNLPANVSVQLTETVQSASELTTEAVIQAITASLTTENITNPTVANQSIETSQDSLQYKHSSSGLLEFFDSSLFVGGVTSAVCAIMLVVFIACLYRAFAKRTRVSPDIIGSTSRQGFLVSSEHACDT